MEVEFESLGGRKNVNKKIEEDKRTKNYILSSGYVNLKF
jgi:hypothetical protein